MKSKSFLIPVFILICLGTLGAKKKKITTYHNRDFQVKISLPDNQWEFSKGFTLESLGFMSHKKTGAVAYIIVNKNPQLISSAQNFRTVCIRDLNQGPAKTGDHFKILDSKIEVVPNLLFYKLEYTFESKGKQYHGIHRFYFYGEEDFGQRMIVLVMIAPQKHFGSPYIQKAFQKIKSSFSHGEPFSTFPYFFSKQFYFSLALLIGGILVILIIVIGVVRRNKKQA